MLFNEESSDPEFLIVREQQSIRWHAFAELGDRDGVVAAVSTRPGGVSVGPFESLNLSFAVGDDPTNVRENRRRFSTAVGIDDSRIVCAEQVHGSQVAYVDERNLGAGYTCRETAIPGVDGMVTDRPGVALWLSFADCVPVLAYDPVRVAIGIAHAGWRGTLAGISVRLVEAMSEQFGSNRSDLRVGIGPSIGPCCYAVGPEVVGDFEREWDSVEGLFPVDSGPVGPRRLNLWEANRRLLVGAGVLDRRIAVSARCTACQSGQFFSHRAQHGRAGRIAGVISLAPEGGNTRQ